MPGQRHSQPTPTSLKSRVYACLGVTCHLHFWLNDRGLLRATAVTRGVERTLNKSQHTKLTLEKKIFPLLLPGFKLKLFDHKSGTLTSKLSQLPSYFHVIDPQPRSTLFGPIFIKAFSSDFYVNEPQAKD